PGDPIVFIHGCPLPGSSNENARSVFDAMVQRFRDVGYPERCLRAITFSEEDGACGPNREYAEEIADFVSGVLADTGAQKVDMVAHSMGGLASRLFIKNGGAALVRDYVVLAGANHGAALPTAGSAIPTVEPSKNRDGSADMFLYDCRPGSVQRELNGCLTPVGRLEDADETPGEVVNYLALWNDVDELTVPTESACLNMTRMNDCSDPVNERVHVDGLVRHDGIASDAKVFERVCEHLTGSPCDVP
ncbi:MAG: esterase/lipase family protein, partial [Candidatus Binatia bacterium]